MTWNALDQLAVLSFTFAKGLLDQRTQGDIDVCANYLDKLSIFREQMMVHCFEMFDHAIGKDNSELARFGWREEAWRDRERFVYRRSASLWRRRSVQHGQGRYHPINRADGNRMGAVRNPRQRGCSRYNRNSSHGLPGGSQHTRVPAGKQCRLGVLVNRPISPMEFFIY